MKLAYVCGRWAINLSFPTEDLCALWLEEVNVIKDRIADINDDGSPDTRVVKYRGWLQGVRRFVTVWGEDYLPPDIKWVVGDVEDHIGDRRTVWADPPENHLNDFGQQRD